MFLKCLFAFIPMNETWSWWIVEVSEDVQNPLFLRTQIVEDLSSQD